MNVCKKGQIALYSKPKAYSTSDYPKKYEALFFLCHLSHHLLFL
jgi:hypothetical protein